MTLTSEFDFTLPPELIAQEPVSPRDASKLLVCHAQGRLGSFSGEFSFSHSRFSDLADFLGPNDFLVLNNAKVLPVRLLGARLLDDGSRGGAVEAVLTGQYSDSEWTAILHLSARAKPGLRLFFEPGLEAEVLSTHEQRLAAQGEVRLRFFSNEQPLTRQALESWLEAHGNVPLPPYIEREQKQADRVVYQTVYAQKTGSAAAPTAGFHFTPEVFAKLATKGVQCAHLTLHVGLGTFRPIKADHIEDHPMHKEKFEITEDFARAYAKAKQEGKRVVTVGTTALRALESWVSAAGDAEPMPGLFETQAYFKPGYAFKAADDLITNFHLPKSTLLVLVSAAMGTQNAREAYRQAIEARYRFFSYGDAMFIRGLIPGQVPNQRAG